MRVGHRQWICDTCGQLIAKPEEGYLQWKEDGQGRMSAYVIVHHIMASPRTTDKDLRGEAALGRGCYAYDGPDSSIDQITMVDMLSWIHVGPVLDPTGKSKTRVADHVAWAETFRRLFLPDYEEARQFFGKAAANGDYDGANEVSPFLPEKLKQVIKDYGP